MIMNETVNYYNVNASKYVSSTVSLDLSFLYKPFLELIPPNGSILDAGCGSGRDVLAFKKMGFEVNAFDASSELVKKASELVGIKVHCHTFAELSCKSCYHGIWACSSLLHIPKKQLINSLHPLIDSLKSKGIFFMSFKYGENEGVIGKRHYTNFTESSMRYYLKRFPDLFILDIVKTEDIRPSGKGHYWLNCLLRKNN